MLHLLGPFSLNRTITRQAHLKKPKFEQDTDELVQKLLGRAEEYRRELRKHIVSSPKHRLIHQSLNSIDKTIGTINMKRKRLDEIFDVTQTPDLISLEVLSNGTTHIRPAVFIRTPFSTYMFNCPEGSSRFIPSLRVRPQTIQDIYITKGHWDNFGGLFGVLLAKEVANHITHLHGPSNIKHFIECVRPFADADSGTSVKQSFQVKERTYNDEKSEDNTMTVYYIPLFEMTAKPKGDNVNKAYDIAYLLELKEPNKRIDINKIIAKKVPKGPMIGKLKAGESVLLEDGTVVKPEEVFAEDSKDLCPNVLVVECDQVEKLDSLVTNSHLQRYKDGQRQMSYIVHLTGDTVLKHDKYQGWMRSFGSQCLHLIANGSGEALPLTDGIYTQNKMFNELCPELFPAIFLQDFVGTITQEVEPPSTNIVHVKHLQRFPMRTTKASVFNELPTITVEESELADRIRENDALPQAIKTFKEEAAKLDLSGSPYPSVTFLGTGSAIPIKYRNVSGHLLQLNAETSVLIDCGEGTYGQLGSLYGPEKIDDELTKLSAIFITHAHLDHIGGIKTFIRRRIEAFERKGLEYKPLILVCNFNVRKMLIMYRTNFHNLEQYVHYTEIGLYIRSENYSNYSCNELQKEITQLFPTELFSAEAWNLKAVTAVQVLHTRMANGFVFDTNDGKRIVFSGDTLPCTLLADAGKDADLLIHEATFEDGYEFDAKRKKHSTTGQAIDIAEQMNAKLLILSHFSARYPRVPFISDRMLNASNIGIAYDSMVVPFNAHKLVPKFVPLCREIFKKELDVPRKA